MKKIIQIFFCIAVFACPPLSSSQNKEGLVFPNPKQKICLVEGLGRDGDLLSGRKMPPDSPLAKAILVELNVPFHQSVIKLSQCSRNLVSDSTGPNVLYLSKNEGGFPRQGLVLKVKEQSLSYPDLFYVDLVLDERRVENGELDIYSHELGHVMMLNIWKNIPVQQSSKQHVSMGITDYTTAVFEGWGIHFQRLAFDNISRYQSSFKESFDFRRSTGRLWHSNIDQELRINGVLQNSFIHQKLLPGVDLSRLSQEELILLEHTSPEFDVTRLKNGQQMLSCEGVLATLFYRINTNKSLQNNFLGREFYNRFLFSPMPDDLEPKDLFSPFENVMLKNFCVWNRLNTAASEDGHLFIEYIKEWSRAFPDDKEEIFKLFILTTAGKTVNNDLGSVHERMAYAGLIGNIQKFRSIFLEYSSIYENLIKKIFSGEFSLESNMGPQLWIQNKDFLIRRTLWDSSRKQPLSINVNTASAFELSTFPGISLEKAEQIIRRREELGYFKSMEEAEAAGFIIQR
jgi:hypothetical protein